MNSNAMIQHASSSSSSQSHADASQVQRYTSSGVNAANNSALARAKDASGALIPVPRTSSLQAPIMLLSGHSGEVYTNKFSPDGQFLASGSSDQSILLWQAHGECKNEFQFKGGHDGAILELHWLVANASGNSGSGQCIVSASTDKTLALWDVEEGVRVKRFKGHKAIVNSCCPSSVHQTNPLVVSGDDDGLVCVWDLRQKHPVSSFEHEWPVTSVCFNGTADVIFSGSVDNEITAWDLRAGKVTFVLQGHQDTVTGVRLSPNGQQLLSTAMDHTVRVWDVKPFSSAPDRLVHQLPGAPHGADKNLLRPCWSPDGSRVACGSADRTAVIWDLKSERILYKLPGHRGTVNEVDWHPREPIVASCSNDRLIYLGEINPAPGSRFK